MPERLHLVLSIIGGFASGLASILRQLNFYSNRVNDSRFRAHALSLSLSFSSLYRIMATTSKAVILLGGPSKGTRMRPLSLDIPKPLFPIAGRPIIWHSIQAASK